MQPLLLDTCALIWIAEGESLKPEAVAALNKAHATNTATFISPISAWEVGLLAARGRLHLLITPQRWFSRLFDSPGVALAAMSPDILIGSSFLPGKPPRDPSDRIILATARDLGATIVTRDAALLNYAKQGHVNALSC